MPSDAGVYIQGTETDPAMWADTAIRRVHQRLRSRLAALAALAAPEPAGAGSGPAPAGEAGHCAEQVRRYLVATDEALYAPAAGAAETRLLVRALRTASAACDRLIDALSTAPDAVCAATAARSLEAVLAVRFAIEQSVLLPALAALPGIDAAGLVADLETLLEGGRLEQPAVVDVREVPHGRRHPRIFARFARLAPGEAFILVNNHDPKPLCREFEAAHAGAFTWDYLESGPEQWRVRIGRTATGA